MATTVTFTLDVYNAAGTSVEFSVSSVVGDTLPYLIGEPQGDGQEFDPLTGETRAGQYTGRIADAITSGTSRVVTSRLEDANYRQQLMRRKAILKKTTGGSDVVLCPGLLTRLTLAGVAEYEYEVTDRTRIRQGVKLFAPRSGVVTLTAGALAGATSLSCQALSIGLPKNTVLNFGAGKTHIVATAASSGATSITTTGKGADTTTNALAVSNGDQANYREGIADFIARWPTRGCAFGGPILGGFMDLPDKGGWVCRLEKFSAAGTILRFQQGYGPPDFQKWITDIGSEAIAKATNDRVGPVQPRYNADAYGAWALTNQFVTTFDQAEFSVFAKDLIVEVLTELGSTSYGYLLPFVSGFSTSLVESGTKPVGGGVTPQAGIVLLAKPSGMPAYNTVVRARALTAGLSEVSPLYIDQHPVDVMTTALTELGYPYDAASATTTKETIGADLRWRDRITASPDAVEYLSQLQGAFGIGLRPQADGDLEFFASRIFDNSPPVVEITDEDVVDPSEMGAGPVFEISETTAIKKVVVEFNALLSVPQDSSERPPDGIVLQPTRIERTNGDPGAVGDRVHQWTLSGMVARVGTFKPDMTYFDIPIREVFDRWGRGVIECCLALLRGGSADSAKLGDEVIVTLPQLPNRNKRYGDDNTVGGRAMQIVRLTQQTWGAFAKLIDSGPNAQPYATAPTISIAANATYPKTVADLTITNAGTLNAAGAGARVRVAVTTGAAPAAGDYADVALFPPGQIPTAAFPLPAVIAGRKVYAKVRAEIPLSNRPSNYSAASSVTLSSYTAPSAVTVTANVSDGTKATVSWTVGESTLRTEIFFRATSGSSASDDVLIEELQLGANAYALTNLKPGTGYTISVRHRDPVSGDISAKATGTVTTASALTALAAPSGVRGYVGVQDGSFGIPTDNASFGIAGRTDVTLIDLEAYQALETAVGSGSYDDYTFLGRAAGRQGTWTPIGNRAPNDGKRRRLKMRLAPQGLHYGIASMLPGEVAALSVAEAAALPAYGLAGTFSEVVTVTPYSNTAVQKTSKTLRVPAQAFVSSGVSLTLNYNVTGTISPSVADSGLAYAPLPIPRGATVVGGRFRGYLNATSCAISIAIAGSDNDASGVATYYSEDIVAPTSGFATTELAENATVEASDEVVLFLIADFQAGGAAVPSDVQLLWVEIDYTAPFLDVSL